MIECMHKYLFINISWRTLHAYMNTEAPRLSQRPDFEALVLLCCCVVPLLV